MQLSCLKTEFCNHTQHIDESLFLALQQQRGQPYKRVSE